MFLYHQGKHTRQAHVGLPENTYEEEHGRQGFFGQVSHLYRKHPPTGWTAFDGELRPHAFDFAKADPSDGRDARGMRIKLLYNDDVAIHVSRRRESMPYYFRNGDGDELHFVHQGTGFIETDFGELHFEPGDYILIPRGTTFRVHVDGSDNFFLVIEAFSEISPPSKEEKGLIGMHALYDLSAVTIAKLPEEYDERAGKDHEIRIQRDGNISSVIYPFNPLDAVGWKGDLYAWKINVRDIRPVMSHRVHLPPPAHTSFVMRNAVVCTFLPRPLEEDSDALKIPFFHKNSDYDEVIFYHAGDFFSRDSIAPGMVTLHPTGIHHGPHPKALERAFAAGRTNEVAVMMDTYHTLSLTPEAETIEWKEYWASWMKK